MFIYMIYNVRKKEAQSTQEGFMSKKSFFTYPKIRDIAWEPLFTPPQKAFPCYAYFTSEYKKISIINTLISF